MNPGSQSSLEHWHSAEDELIYVLEGEVTLVEGQTKSKLFRGEAATFKAGVEVAHHLINKGDHAARYLVIGTRAPVDFVTYPAVDRVCHRDRDLPEDIWLDLDGTAASNPYDDPKN